MSYPMLKHGIDQLCIRRTPLFGGSVLGTSTGFASDVIKQISDAVRYSQEHSNTQYSLVVSRLHREKIVTKPYLVSKEAQLYSL